jgi:hypothetical protein
MVSPDASSSSAFVQNSSFKECCVSFSSMGKGFDHAARCYQWKQAPVSIEHKKTVMNDGVDHRVKDSVRVVVYIIPEEPYKYGK